MTHRPGPDQRRTGLSRFCISLLLAAWLIISPATALAQAQGGADNAAAGQGTGATNTFDPTNPLMILDQASRALPLNQAGQAAGQSQATEASQNNEGLSATLSIVLLLTIMSLAPAILVMCTSFTRIVIVLSLLRQAIGTQTLPPSQVIVGLSLFMTFLVMAPTFQQINERALQPMQEGQIDQITAWDEAKEPLKEFMLRQIAHAGNWQDVYMIMQYRQLDISNPDEIQLEDLDMLTVIPAFILSELKIAFLMGFRLYLPFLIIDMVVASVLISMGMLMLPPILISLPFKLLLFVMTDGWHLVAGNLLYSFSTGGGG